MVRSDKKIRLNLGYIDVLLICLFNEVLIKMKVTINRLFFDTQGHITNELPDLTKIETLRGFIAVLHMYQFDDSLMKLYILTSKRTLH